MREARLERGCDRFGARLGKLKIRRKRDSADRVGVRIAVDLNRARLRSSAAAIFAAIGAKESLTFAPPEGNSTTLPMRMKIVVADWSASTLPARISFASAARMRWSCVEVCSAGSGGGLTTVSRAIVNSVSGWTCGHLDRERFGPVR